MFHPALKNSALLQSTPKNMPSNSEKIRRTEFFFIFFFEILTSSYWPCAFDCPLGKSLSEYLTCGHNLYYVRHLLHLRFHRREKKFDGTKRSDGSAIPSVRYRRRTMAISYSDEIQLSFMSRKFSRDATSRSKTFDSFEWCAIPAFVNVRSKAVREESSSEK